jgi:hypothetical protein
MGLFDQLGQQQNPMQMLQQIRQNPAAILQRAGLNIPAGMTDPQQIIQHLMQSGQVSQQRYQQAMQMMRRK